MSRYLHGRAPSAHALGAAQLVAWGVTFYAIPPLLPHVSGELDLAMTSLSLAMTVGLVLCAFGSLGVAAWIRRRGARGPMVGGSIIAAGALLVLASSRTAATAFTSLAVLGAAHAALLYEPVFAAISSQTRDPVARVRTIQIVTFWGGWAALWAVPASMLLAEYFGWRVALLVLAFVLATHTIRVHGRMPPPASSITAAATSTSPPVSRRLAVAFALGAFATTAVVVNGLMLLAERHVELAVASVVFALLAPVQVIGRAWFMRRDGRFARQDGALPFVLVAIGIAALLAAPRSCGLAIFVVLFGAGAGLLTPVRAAVVAARAAPEHVVKQIGTIGFVTSLARAAAPVSSTWLYTTFGFEASLIALAAMAFVAAALVWSSPWVSPHRGLSCP